MSGPALLRCVSPRAARGKVNGRQGRWASPARLPMDIPKREVPAGDRSAEHLRPRWNGAARAGSARRPATWWAVRGRAGRSRAVGRAACRALPNASRRAEERPGRQHLLNRLQARNGSVAAQANARSRDWRGAVPWMRWEDCEGAVARRGGRHGRRALLVCAQDMQTPSHA